MNSACLRLRSRLSSSLSFTNFPVSLSSFRSFHSSSLLSSSSSSSSASSHPHPRHSHTPNPDDLKHDMYRGFPKIPMAIDFVPDSVKRNEVYCFAPAQGVRHIVLNRPKVFNSLNINMVRQLSSILDGIKADKDVYLAVMTGAPSVRQLEGGATKRTQVFCAGGDVKTLWSAGHELQAKGERRPDDHITRTFFREEYELDFKIANMAIPFVPIMNGTTMGGGVGVSIHSRFRAATPSTVFAMPECDLGFFPDVGGSYFLSHLNGGLGLYLALTGHRLQGYDLVHAGLATHFCHDDAPSMLNQVMQTVSINAFQSQDAVEYLFALLDRPENPPSFSLDPYWDLIDSTFQYTSIEKILSECKRLSTDSKQSEKTRHLFKNAAAAIERASPVMLKVTLEMLKRGSKKSLQQCLEMEYRATQVCMDSQDFYTGVHAKLVAKDNKSVPAWSPAKLDAVSPQMVEKYFAEPARLHDRELELKLQYEGYKEREYIS